MSSVDIVVENGQLVEQAVLMPLLGNQALIMTAHERPVEGRVTVSYGGRIEITVGFVPLEAERRWSRGLFLEYAVETGVYRMRARLVDIERKDGLFLVRMDTIDRATLLLTRQHVRATVTLPVRIKREGRWQKTVSVDIGGGGLRLPFELGLEVGEHVELEIDGIPPHGMVRAEARVVREAPEGGFGVLFTDIGDDERAALMGLAFGQRRASAHRV
jgi:hypothetical protein